MLPGTELAFAGGEIPKPLAVAESIESRVRAGSAGTPRHHDAIESPDAAGGS